MKSFYFVFPKSPFAAHVDVVPWGGSDKQFCLARIKVDSEFRGRGYGRQLLLEVLNDADAEQVTLFLEVHPYAGGLSYEQLVEWYKRHGFQKSGQSDLLIRNPQRGAK